MQKSPHYPTISVCGPLHEAYKPKRREHTAHITRCKMFVLTNCLFWEGSAPSEREKQRRLFRCPLSTQNVSIKLLFKWLTNRGHCDTTLWWATSCLLHELTHIKMKPSVLYCLKGFSHWPCLSLFGVPVSSTSSHEGQTRVNIGIKRFWRCRFKCS